MAALAVFVAVAAMPALAAKDAKDDAVIAIVNGDKIYRKDVVQAAKQLSVPDEAMDVVVPEVLDQVINEKLLDDAIAKTGLADSDDYKKRLEVLRVQLLKQMYLENFLKQKVTDGAVRAEYNKFVRENKGKTEVHARHILVPTEQEAKQVIKDLDAGADFVELARKRSSGPTAQNGGDLGYFVKEEMVPEFSKAAFDMKAGTYSKAPVKTQFGWHVIKVEAKRDRKVPKQEEVEGAIRNMIGQRALKDMVTELRGKSSIQKFDLSGKPVTDEAPAKKK